MQPWKVALFQAQNDLLASLRNCFFSCLSLERAVIMVYNHALYVPLHSTNVRSNSVSFRISSPSQRLAVWTSGHFVHRVLWVSLFFIIFFPIVKANSWLHCSWKHILNLHSVFIHLCFSWVLILHYCQNDFLPWTYGRKIFIIFWSCLWLKISLHVLFAFSYHEAYVRTNLESEAHDGPGNNLVKLLILQLRNHGLKGGRNFP